MRYYRIFLLKFQDVFIHRSRSFVWFIIALLQPVLFLLFWIGKLKGAGGSFAGWELPAITSYYFLIVVLAPFLMSHVEDDVAHDDIAQGNLVNYLTKPFSYFWYMFLRELPYRVLQGACGAVIFVVLLLFFHNFFIIATSPIQLFLSIFVIILAHMLAYMYKLIIGLLAFWFTDIGGLFQLSEALIFIFAGYILPLPLLPGAMANIAQFLPFAYMIYYPVVALQGGLSLPEVGGVILAQSCWIIILMLIYQFVWSQGIKKFTGVGR